MTQQTPTRSFLKHSQPLLTKCLQAALIAAPVLLAAAPSEAITVKTTVNGFTGEFASGKWSVDPSTPGTNTSAVVNGSAITLFKSLASGGTASAFRTLNDGVWDALRPKGAGRILSWKATGLYDFTKAGSNTSQNTNSRYTFTSRETPSGAPLNLLAGAASNIVDANFTLGESYFETPYTESDPSQVRFSLGRAGSSGNVSNANATGVIDNFQFVAEYDVPGPLPVVGAAAAFAWSRRLRKRLNSAKTLA
jgi:hypothetical protein